MNYDEMKRMQEAAARRVSEMDRRSRNIVNSINGFTSPRQQNADDERFKPVRDVPVPKNIKMPVELPTTQPHSANAKTDGNARPHFVYEPSPEVGRYGASSSDGRGARRTNVYGGAAKPGILGSLSKDDTERLFLLSLCMLLKNENADEELITALMYIMT